jgi:uncharacterized protein YaaW (UPF0174 family)
MSEIRVELKAEDINRAIAEAVLHSVLGETLVKMVNEYVANITKQYDHPVKKIIEQEVVRLTQQLLGEKMLEIDLAIQKHLTAEALDKLIKEVVGRVKVY